MTSYVSGEVSIFLWSIVSGVIIMVAHDIFSVAVNKNSYSILVCNILDGIFVTCATAIMIFILLNISYGYIRSYEFVGAFIGGFLYRITLSPFVKIIFSKIFHVFFEVFQFFLKLLLTPIKFMYKIMYNSISVLSRVCSRILSPVSRALTLTKISLKKHRSMS